MIDENKKYEVVGTEVHCVNDIKVGISKILPMEDEMISRLFDLSKMNSVNNCDDFQYGG